MGLEMAKVCDTVLGITRLMEVIHAYVKPECKERKILKNISIPERCG
jgi:hypothetical protein